MLTSEIAEPTRWLGETVGFWIQNLILGVSAIAGIWVIRASKIQEKRRATIDLVMDQKRDPVLTKSRDTILALHEANETNFAKYLESVTSEEYKSILFVLNTYEFVGSGIREGAFDEKTYKRLRYSNVIRDWEGLCAFVMAFRRQKNNKRLFQEFEWLALRWRKKPLKASSK